MKTLIVGEFISQVDASEGKVFSDGNWRFLKARLRAHEVPKEDYEFAYTLPVPAPSTGGLLSFFGPRERAVRGHKGFRFGQRVFYLDAKYHHYLTDLWATINRTQPNLVVALGDLAVWALTEHQSANSARGRVTFGHAGIGGRKVLPMLSPREVLSVGVNTPLFFADMEKMKRESAFDGVRRPQRFIHLRPTLDDLAEFKHLYLDPAEEISVDIETKGEGKPMITCIGFAPGPERCLVVPFFTEAHSSGNYWPSLAEELAAWRFVRLILNDRRKRILGQNFSYDLQQLLRCNGIKVPSWHDDTMILHHAMQPGMRKSLGFLGSIYTDELEWKSMGKRKASDKAGKKQDD